MISIGDIFRKRRRGARHLETGALGEKIAARHLQLEGYRVVALNFTAPIGYSQTGRPLTGEIDIIAYDESSVPITLAFIEVKTRTKTEIAAPESAVDRRKQRRIARAARVYRRLLAVEDEPYRYDVVSIVITPNGEPRPTLRRGYFSERSFLENR
jgi:putative endonuclease